MGDSQVIATTNETDENFSFSDWRRASRAALCKELRRFPRLAHLARRKEAEEAEEAKSASKGWV